METPEFYNGYYNAQTTPDDINSHTKLSNQFVVENFLDFQNDDVFITDGSVHENVTDGSTLDNCNSTISASQMHGDNGCQSFTDTHFSIDLCVPYDDVAELEWLSNFLEESFSSEDMHRLQMISGMKECAKDESSETQKINLENNQNATAFDPDMMVPGKARSKRSRVAPCNWASRLLILSLTLINTQIRPYESESNITFDYSKKTINATHKKKEASHNTTIANRGGDVRKCLHCATDKTPQWRTGTMGPKTFCNACGVRHKSGRLVPEYRPASSPTFMLTKHSNSHRKVLELRRQKEVEVVQQHQQFFHHNRIFEASNSDDYLINQHIGTNYHQLI